MFDKPADAQRVGNYVDQHIDAITNALHNHAERMTDTAKEARAAYDAGQNDPDVKAAQDRSYVTNNGMKHSAALFEESASGAREIARTLRAMIEGPDDTDEDDDATHTWTFMGHWENDHIVVEHAVRGNLQDERKDTGYWEQGLWAAAGTGATIEEAEVNARAEYETDE